MKHYLTLKHFAGLFAAVFLFVYRVDCQTVNNEDEEVIVEPQQALIDSLKSLITPSTPNNLLAEYYCEIAEASLNFDTIIKYANLSLPLCADTNYVLLGTNNLSIGRAYHHTDNNTTALPYMIKAISLLEKNKNPESLISVYQNISYTYDELNNLDSSVYYITKTLEIGNRLGDTALMAECYQDLGRMFGQRELYDESKMYIRKALVLDSLSKNRFRYALDLFTLVLLIDTQEPDSVQEYLVARDYMNKVVNVLDTVESYHKYLAYGTFVSVYMHLAKLTGQHKYADSSLYYYKKAEPFFDRTISVSNYRAFRYYYVDYLLFYKKYAEALKVMRELEDTFGEGTSAVELTDFHNEYKSIYIAMGDYKNAYHHLEMQQKYDRANFNDSTLSALSDVKAQQISMMEKLEREKNEAIHASEKRQMHIVIISLIGGLFLVSLLVFYIARILQIKRRSNKELAEKNLLLVEKNSEIEAQKKIIVEQWQEVEKVNDKLVKSINYARRIQRSLLTPDKTIESVFPDHFLLYKPRDVVSGDYYWIGQFGDNKVCIVADCTGHGVPGGFLSVLGMSNLNHIVGQNISPDAILNHLRESIISNLRQENDVLTNASDRAAMLESLNRSRDGMDAAVYVVNEKQMKLSFAGANNPLILIRGNEMQVFKADHMPVGIFKRMEPFSCTTIDIQCGDCLYTFSDGFQDQFGYNSGQKFMGKRLRELLLEIHERPMAEQKEILNQTYEEWRGPAENQTDDVVIMGVRI